MFKKLKFGSKLYGGVLALVLCAMLSMGLVSAYNIYQKSLALGESLLEGATEQAVNVLELYHKTSLSRLKAACDVLINMVEPVAMSERYDSNSRIVDAMRARFDVSATIFYRTEKGFLRTSSNIMVDGKRIVGTLIDSGPVFEALSAGQSYEGVAEVAGVWRIVEYRPVKYENVIVGAVFTGKRIFTEELNAYLDKLNINGKGYAFIFNGDGRFLHHPDADVVNVDMTKKFPWGKDMLQVKNGLFQYDWAGQSKITSIRTYEPFGWRVGMGMTKAEMLHGLDGELLRSGMVGALIAVFVSVVCLFLMVRAFMRPIRSIAEASEKIAGGDYDVEIDYAAADDIGATARSVERLAGTIKEKLGFIQGVLEAIKSPNVVGDKNGRILHLNQEMLDILGVDGYSGVWVGKLVSELVHQDSSKKTILEQVVADHQPRIGSEMDVVTRQGDVRHVRVDSVPLYDLDGELIGACSIWTDLTDIRKQQAQIEENHKRLIVLADEIDAFTQHVASASDELAAQIDQASSGSEKQRDRTSETAAAMEQMNATVLEVARNAGRAVEGARGVQAKSKEGAGAVNQVMQAMSHVNDLSQALKADIDELGRQAESITSVISVINDIADQTNLLALNAAIEAARAGEAGRGFAVVADEVRKLAEKTMGATKEVGESIGGIARTVEKNVRAVAESSEAIADSNALAAQAGGTLRQILDISGDAADQIASIATAAEEQSATSEQINRSVEEINSIASETAKAMGHSAQAVSELARQVADLKELVARMSA